MIVTTFGAQAPQTFGAQAPQTRNLTSDPGDIEIWAVVKVKPRAEDIIVATLTTPADITATISINNMIAELSSGHIPADSNQYRYLLVAVIYFDGEIVNRHPEYLHMEDLQALLN